MANVNSGGLGPNRSSSLTQTEGHLRKLVLCLRWPPITVAGGLLGIWVAIFGAPSAVALWISVMVLLVWSQVGGLIDILPRAARWLVWFHQHLLEKLSDWCEWQKRKIDQINRIWSDPWDE
jgi:hypothetical protein